MHALPAEERGVHEAAVGVGADIERPPAPAKAEIQCKAVYGSTKSRGPDLISPCNACPLPDGWAPEAALGA